METEELTPEQNQLCIGVGKLMEQNSSPTIESLIGNKIQQKAYQREGNEELVASLQKQADINEKLYAFSEKQWSASTLMLFDEKLFQYWLDAAINYGEQKAQQLLYKEAITLSKNEGDKTIYELQDEENKKVLELAKKTEVYKKVKELFPDAELTNVDKVKNFNTEE